MRKSHVCQFTTFGLIGSLLAIPAVVGSSGCDLDDAQTPQSVESADEIPTAGEALPIDEPAGPADEPVIYGGNPVTSCGWPTTVSLEGSCTGTLIHPEVVIYAAHCGTKFKSIRFGDDGSGKSDGFSVSTKYCRKYPGYSDNKKGVDFAYCRLSEPVDEFPVVPPLMGCETEALESRTTRHSSGATARTLVMGTRADRSSSSSRTAAGERLGSPLTEASAGPAVITR